MPQHQNQWHTEHLYAVLQRSQDGLTDYLTRVVQPKLVTVSGVQRADILGAGTFAMRIWLKPDRMTALQVTASDVSNALSSNNVLAAVGSTKGQMVAIDMTARTDLRNADEFRQLIIREQNGAIVRLGDVADVQAPEAELAAQLTDAVKPAIAALATRLATAAWDKAGVSAAIKETITAHGIKMPQLAMPVRVLVMGTAQTPSLDAVLELQNQQTVLTRLQNR